MGLITYRALQRDELDQIWTIDRSELISNVYRLRNGELVKEPGPVNVAGWSPEVKRQQTRLHRECFDRGGFVMGAFDADQLVGVSVLDSRFRGPQRDQLQLVFLHVGSGHRQRGIGQRLFEAARKEARRLGAQALYVSATPSENTVDFYIRRGCVLAEPPDDELFRLEPEDIHFVCPV